MALDHRNQQDYQIEPILFRKIQTSTDKNANRENLVKGAKFF